MKKSVMSHSSFKLISNDEPIKNLVIVVNKNGEVGTDTDALRNLLTSKETPETAITIIRETSPTPSINDEIEEERSSQRDLYRQQYITEHPNASEDEIEQQLKKMSNSDDIHVSLNIENFYTPDQAKTFVSDVLNLGGIDNPQTLMPMDLNYRRKICQMDHDYTSFTMSPEPGDLKAASKTNSSKSKESTKHKRELKQTPKARQMASQDDVSSESGDNAPENSDFDEEQSAEEEEISFSESDDDNDMDFSVNDRFGKKGKKKRKYRKHKQKNLTFKDFLEGGGELSSVEDESKKKYGKSPKKAAAPRPSTSGGKNIAPSSYSKNSPQTGAKKVPLPTQTKVNPVKKEAPPPTTQTFIPVSSLKPATTSSSSTTVNIGGISIQSAAPTKTPQEIEFVELIVKDLEKSFPENDSDKKLVQSTPSTIPNIMQMMETNTPTEVIDQSLSTLENMDAADGAVGIEEIGNALIAVLGNEAIDELLNQEDLMNFDPTHSTPVIKPSQQQHSLVSLSVQPTHSALVLQQDSVTSPTSTQMPKILNKQAPAKDAVKVVRNGRVITLPPIEAPATRGAKRRAQGDVPATSPVGKVVKTEKTPSIKDPDSRNSSRRSSLNKSESGRNSRRQSNAQATNADEENDDANSDATWNSEDDPERLWCICMQPHNNRFMICCDKCEDWFHGTCVNVTKAMGKEMETKDIKWLCPNCKSNGNAVKKDPNKKNPNQQKLTKYFSKLQKDAGDSDPEEDIAKNICVVCHQKTARPESIYCSDECIRSHANKHLDESPKLQASSNKPDQPKRGNVLKDQSGNVIVYDTVTGKLLSSKLWPHFTTLGQWLSQNPNCAPVKPGSPHAAQLLSSISSKKNAQAQNSTPTTPSHSAKSTPSAGDELFSNPVKINTGASATTPNPALKSPGASQPQKSTLIRSNSNVKSPSVSLKSPPASKSPSVSSSTSHKSSSTKHEVKKVLKKQTSEDKPVSNSSSKSKIEYERMNVRNNFKTTLIQRMQEFEHPSIKKMSDSEVEDFAKEIESEMFRFFNKDTRDKYKVKFRSLKFNLSDTKNKTLIERICAKKLTPKQLVELPPSALASEELAKWREDENKHQLEIITKSELDALAQNKIVVKTHKGEEIIETKTAPADILVPVDDVESVIAKTVLSVEDPHGRYDLSRSISLNVSGGHSVTSPLSSPSITSSTGRKSDHRSRSRSKSRGRDHHHHKSSKHKKSERHRSKSPKHHSHHSHHHSRDKSHGRSRDKSRERDHSKKRSEDKHHRDKSRSNELEKSSSSKSKDNRESSKESKKHHHKEHHKEKKEKEIKPEQEDVDLVGKILDSMGVHLDVSKPKETETEKIESEDAKQHEVTSTEIDPIAPVSLEPINEHQLEIEIYSGNMYMADIAKFDVTASTVSGNVDDIIKLFPPQLEIVGRIEPKTVWDYLGKVKKLPGKELTVIRFASVDAANYFKLFSYLHTRQRYGVIKPLQPLIKDFYLITVEANRPLPSVLLPIVGPGFIEGEDHKPDLLIGVILKVTPESKHHKISSKALSNKKSLKPTRPPVVIDHPIEILSAKHKSHHSSKLTIGLPEVRCDDLKLSPSKSLNDGDEPYEPFDDDDEDSLSGPSSFMAGLVAPPEKKLIGDDLESEIGLLNRQIEQRQMEIQSLAQQKAMELDEASASRIYETISVPANLSEILSTIKASEPKPMDIDNNDENDEYIPMATTNISSSVEYRATTSYGSAQQQQPAPVISSMMDIDERINLFRNQELSQSVISTLPTSTSSEQKPSLLATMTDSDLMKLVPDDALPPPPPIITRSSEPAIPGLEYDDMEI